MLNALTLSRYCPGSSLLHRADARTKILLTLLLMVTAYAVQSFPALLVLFLLVIGLGGGVGKPVRQSLLGLKPILYFAGAAVAVNLVFIAGPPLVDWVILRHISQDALLTSTRMILRLAVLAAAATLLTFTTTPLALTQGLESLLKPLGRIGVPIAEMAMILLIALRFMPVLAEEAEKLLMARAEQAKQDRLAQRVRSYGALLIPLFAGVARRGDAMVAAMEARCYRGPTARTRMRPLEFSGEDIACAGLLLLVLSVVIGVESVWAGKF